jgi:anaerobic magnesium-protoporphyrin IX monomethyl ester cyclase
MKVLLINPNKYKSPPVPPIGLEYLAASLERNSHAVEILDLCFSEALYTDIDNAVASFRPDVAGITVRNVDTVLYQTNEFFLDEIREVVNYLKVNRGLKTIIGGTGVSSNPSGVLDYLNADCGIAGPAEDTIHEVLTDIRTSGHGKIYRCKYREEISCCRRPLKIDYAKYCGAGGVIGFETHKGCSSSCVYCLEANSRVSFKHTEDVVKEVRSFVDIGYNHFHLCDSEFNESLEYSIAFCSALKKSGLDIRWAVYMKPANFNKPLFRLLKDTGVYLITLTVDSWKKCPLYWEDYEKFVFGAKSFGIKVAVDFLTGFPYESDDNLSEYFDMLRRPLPDSVGVNTYLRLYSTLQITDIILRDENLKSRLLGEADDQTLLRPVFYNHIDTDALKRLINGDPIFRVEGTERGVNYGRVET